MWRLVFPLRNDEFLYAFSAGVYSRANSDIAYTFIIDVYCRIGRLGSAAAL